jgi:hypothetical protein
MPERWPSRGRGSSDLGEFDDVVILKRFGGVPEDFDPAST